MSSAQTKKATPGGPLTGVRVVELAGIGPAPFCSMLLADMGADVIRLDRIDPGSLGVPLDPRHELLRRNRRSVAIDLKKPEGAAAARRLIAKTDALVEGYRPGVMERLGLGPTECLGVNPRLIYGRVTGWGRDGPLAGAAGHDINYIALTGILAAIGPSDGPPVPPLNLIGDYGGGGVFLAFGIVCGLLEARTSGIGQVVDASMVECASSLATAAFAQVAAGWWVSSRGSNLLDGGAPWYSTYETADGSFVAVGAIEPKFYAELLQRLGLADEALPDQYDRAGWPTLRARLAEVFRSRSRDEWSAILEGTDACYAPVLTFPEALTHEHNRSRASFVESDGTPQPRPAPRFSRTDGRIESGPAMPGQHTDEALAAWGFAPDEIATLRKVNAVR